jgi:hypothetical protein
MATPGLKIEFPAQMDLRIASLFVNMSEGRMRALVREGKIVGEKTDAGWMFNKTDLEKFLVEPRTRAQGTRKASPAGKALVIHVTADKMQAVKDALANIGVELEPRYDYTKQRAYQLKRKAEKAAAKKNGTAAAPAPVAVPASPANTFKK